MPNEVFVLESYKEFFIPVADSLIILFIGLAFVYLLICNIKSLTGAIRAKSKAIEKAEYTTSVILYALVSFILITISLAALIGPNAKRDTYRVMISEEASFTEIYDNYVVKSVDGCEYIICEKSEVANER